MNLSKIDCHRPPPGCCTVPSPVRELCNAILKLVFGVWPEHTFVSNDCYFCFHLWAHLLVSFEKVLVAMSDLFYAFSQLALRSVCRLVCFSFFPSSILFIYLCI